MFKRKRKKEGELRLTDKKHPISGIWSVLIGVFALIMFIVTCFISGDNGGKGGMIVGVVGILCFIISVSGFILSTKNIFFLILFAQIIRTYSELI